MFVPLVPKKYAINSGVGVPSVRGTPKSLYVFVTLSFYDVLSEISSWIWKRMDVWYVQCLAVASTYCVSIQKTIEIKGQLGVPLTMYPWYLLCSVGILGDYNP